MPNELTLSTHLATPPRKHSVSFSVQRLFGLREPFGVLLCVVFGETNLGLFVTKTHWRVLGTTRCLLDAGLFDPLPSNASPCKQKKIQATLNLAGQQILYEVRDEIFTGTSVLYYIHTFIFNSLPSFFNQTE